jgi:ABC-type multidrug transport system fused ATPase/permease subunit
VGCGTGDLPDHPPALHHPPRGSLFDASIEENIRLAKPDATEAEIRRAARTAPILILDEPTSALDPKTEQQLVAALREASRDRIVIVIAHRLSTIREADQILFIEAGRSIERGTHAELMTQQDGAYRHFVELETRGVA